MDEEGRYQSASAARTSSMFTMSEVIWKHRLSALCSKWTLSLLGRILLMPSEARPSPLTRCLLKEHGYFSWQREILNSKWSGANEQSSGRCLCWASWASWEHVDIEICAVNGRRWAPVQLLVGVDLWVLPGLSKCVFYAAVGFVLWTMSHFSSYESPSLYVPHVLYAPRYVRVFMNL